jgi:hypothetical protein
MIPRERLSTQMGKLTKNFVPRKTPPTVNNNNQEKRRKISRGRPPLNICVISITMLGIIRMTMAVRISSRRVTMGVEINGNPIPVVPLVKAAKRRAAATSRVVRSTGMIGLKGYAGIEVSCNRGI